MTWIIWIVLACTAFIVGFVLGAITAADSALAAAKRESDDEAWHD